MDQKFFPVLCRAPVNKARTLRDCDNCSHLHSPFFSSFFFGREVVTYCAARNQRPI